MTEREILIAINNTNIITPYIFYKLLKKFGNPKNIWQASLHELSTSGLNLNKIQKFIQKREEIIPQIPKILKRLKDENISIITYLDSNYPKLLKEISDPPYLLYYKGNINIINNTLLSIVGTRKITAYGKQVIDNLVSQLVQYNITTVSGLAFGVDYWVHKTTLQNKGLTIAVLPSPLNQIIPKSHYKIAENIIENRGLLISEIPITTRTHKYSFIYRNRIISGLSKATMIIEAPQKSGALITARYALEQNRDVLAIPGSIFSKTSSGTNNLIKEGALTITSIQDILEYFSINYPKNYAKPQNKLSKDLKLNTEQEKIYKQIHKYTKLHINDIIQNNQLPYNQVLKIITDLELKNLIKNQNGLIIINTNYEG